MHLPLLRYTEPLYRPPSEANSLILQVTNGCSFNKCSFCEMYQAPQKRFRPKSEDEISAEIMRIAPHCRDVRRVFLADGDAMVLSARRLLKILQLLQQHLPQLQRVSAYCLPRNLSSKSDSELRQLAQAGLSLVYVGAESGDDLVLQKVNKGETFTTTVTALNRLADAGIRRSVMILNGLGGVRYSDQHADGSAALANASQPEYLATLVVSFPLGEARFRKAFGDDYQPVTTQSLFEEMFRFISQLELNKTIFRSDHASNYLVLKGVLNRDRSKLLQRLRQAIEQPNSVALRPEWARGF